MISSLADLERARLPAAALGRLAALRCQPGVQVALHDRDLWIRWEPSQDAIALALLPLAGCQLFGRKEGHWYAWGHALPAFEVPESLRFRPLFQVIFPAPMQPVTPDPSALVRTTLRLVADTTYRATQAMQCPLDLFRAWADAVPGCVLARYQGAVKKTCLFVLGKKLPWLASGERFWGHRVLVPIGYRTDPLLAEADLLKAAGVAETDLLVLRPAGCEIVATDRFTFLSHAALRLSNREVSV
jgi:MoxR-vWA-beta-propeller ternary system domain bpX2